MDDIVARIQVWLAQYGLNVVGAVVILVLGWLAARIARNVLSKVMRRVKVEDALVSFVASLTYVTVMAFVVIAALSKLGIQTASFIAVLGAAGLAVGLALQGSLANFAAGVLIITFRPIRVGDYIEAGGATGLVEQIEIFTTTLKTVDNRKVILPNAKLTSDKIINYTANDTRRVDLVIGVSYQADLDKAGEVILDTLRSDERVLTDPAPQVAVSELADSSVNFVVRPWVKTPDYWDVYFGATKAIKQRLDAEGIGIPFPQRDVHLYQTQA